MLGTTRVREPSFLTRSMAMPRLIASGMTVTGLPLTASNELFISGCDASAWTIAYPMRWVKLTLPPRPRASALLMTMRLSESSLAGTARTLVAVGRVSEASILDTIRAATPRMGAVCAPGRTSPAGAVGALAGSALAGSALVGSALAGSTLAGATAGAAGPAVGVGVGGEAVGAVFAVGGAAAGAGLVSVDAVAA